MPDGMDAPRPPRAVVFGTLFIVTLALLRCLVTHVATPFWDMDPLTVPSPMSAFAASDSSIMRVLGAPLVGIGPSASLLLDTLSLLAAALVLSHAPALGARRPTLSVSLGALGSIGVVVHVLWLHSGDIETARVGSAWLAAIWSGIAVMHACTFGVARRLVLATVSGFIVFLAAKAIVQVSVEHVQTVASFKEDRDAFLAARGWSPGSPQALAYERRLNQPDATGWFGLSNVLASFAAASLAIGAGLMLLTRRGPGSRRTVAVAVAVCAAALVTLALTRSKAGFVVALIAVGLAALTRVIHGERFERVHALATPSRVAMISILLVGLPHAVVALRGLIGERLSEASLWFRWFYVEAAARVTSSHPLTGVGPAGFQDAYSLQKNPLSPEEVTSPHSLAWDDLATLGVFGAMWVALILCMAWRAGRWLGDADLRTSANAPALPAKATTYSLAATCGAPVFVSLWLERGASLPGILSHALDPSGSMWALVVGLLLVMGLLASWIAVAAVLALCAGPVLITSGALAAIALLIHAQVEMTPVQPASAQLFMVIVGAAAVNGRSAPSAASTRRTTLPHAVPALALGAVLGFGVLPRVLRWEASLVAAAHEIEPIGRLTAQLRDASRQMPTQETPELRRISEEASALIGVAVSPRSDAIEAALRSAARARIPSALAQLQRAIDATGYHDRSTVRATASLCLTQARAEESQTQSDWYDRAHLIAQGALEANSDSAWPHSLAARVLAARSRETDRTELLATAISHWEAELRLNPFGMSTVLSLMNASKQLARTQDASKWAQRALELDRLARLDPTRQLNESVLLEVRRLAAAP
ncbi:MAG: O-antigen ligase family protein [Phycisphaeraceae bacterium]|nr:O-antigen ligase family protein [Phycisphaeraceae bacterium]